MAGQLKYSPIDMNSDFDTLLKARDWKESRVT